MTFLLRVLTVLEIMLFIKRLKEGDNPDDVFPRDERRDRDPVRDSNEPT